MVNKIITKHSTVGIFVYVAYRLEAWVSTFGCLAPAGTYNVHSQLM